MERSPPRSSSDARTVCRLAAPPRSWSCPFELGPSVLLTRVNEQPATPFQFTCSSLEIVHGSYEQGVGRGKGCRIPPKFFRLCSILQSFPAHKKSEEPLI